MGCHLHCIQKLLEVSFYKYGMFVARHPIPFIIIPILMTAVSSIGLLNLREVDDPEYLYTPIKGPGKTERSIIKSIYLENDTHMFMPTRKTEFDGFLQVIITGKDGLNLFQASYMDEVIKVDEEIQSVACDNGTANYQDVCGLWKGQCLQNTIISILNGKGETVNHLPITYPQHLNSYFIAHEVGGVKLNKDDQIVHLEAVRLSYFVRYSSEEDKTRSNLWFEAVKQFLLNYHNDKVKVYFQTALTINEELAKSTEGIFTRFALTYSVLFTFCFISCVMTDWVRTKIWVVLVGQLAALMSVITGFGIMCAVGLPFATTVGSMPFLIAGIGIDDMFVILSSWRHTSVTLPYRERTGQTMQVAAISITVTSVTDALAFGIGSLTGFRAVTLFCAYTGCAVIFSYIYAITLLPACFALSGKSEEQNRHELTCQQIVPVDMAVGRSALYRMFCTGGQEKKPTEHYQPVYIYPMITMLIKEKIAVVLMKVPTKILVIIVYVFYIAIAMYGCSMIKDNKGLKLEKLALSNSYVIPFYHLEERYFRQDYGARIMVSFNDPLDYSNEETGKLIEQELNQFRSSPMFYSDDSYTESWLHSFMMFLNLTHQNPQDMRSFINILTTQFLVQPYFDIYTLDIVISPDNSEILASRVFLQGKGMSEDDTGEKLMTTSREIAEKSMFNLTVYHPTYVFLDQFTVIYSNTIQNLAIAVGSMLIVSAMLLPSIVSVICVTLSVISICTGVFGFMLLWDVGLDSVSMINLIMCIGFSVDFSAHISYHFSISQEPTGNQRAIEALGHIGTPIIQGAVSTILGVLILATSESYIFITFFKIMFLVMSFGFAHAMFLLPVILSVIYDQCRKRQKSKSSPPEQYTMVKVPPPNTEFQSNGLHFTHNGVGNGVAKLSSPEESLTPEVKMSSCNSGDLEFSRILDLLNDSEVQNADNIKVDTDNISIYDNVDYDEL